MENNATVASSRISSLTAYYCRPAYTSWYSNQHDLPKLSRIQWISVCTHAAIVLDVWRRMMMRVDGTVMRSHVAICVTEGKRNWAKLTKREGSACYVAALLCGRLWLSHVRFYDTACAFLMMGHVGFWHEIELQSVAARVLCVVVFSCAAPCVCSRVLGSWMLQCIS